MLPKNKKTPSCRNHEKLAYRSDKRTNRYKGLGITPVFVCGVDVSWLSCPNGNAVWENVMEPCRYQMAEGGGATY